MYQDQKGYWWIGANKGIFLYDETNDKLRLIQLNSNGTSETLIFNRVIEQVNSNQILLAGQKVFLLTNPWDAILNDKAIEIENELFDAGNSNQINDYAKDSFGNHWFTSSKGVFRVEVQTDHWLVKDYFTTSSKNKSLALSYNHVFSIHVASNKTVWLGTYGGGLMRVDLDAKGIPENIKSYHRNDGLRDEVIYGILEDSEGMLWMSTDMGICYLNLNDEVFNFYDVNDGVLSNNFRQSAFLKTREGIMLMGE
nr:two-component regulator propeller domain-containing protein [Algibacter sp. L3A6]